METEIIKTQTVLIDTVAVKFRFDDHHNKIRLNDLLRKVRKNKQELRHIPILANVDF